MFGRWFFFQKFRTFGYCAGGQIDWVARFDYLNSGTTCSFDYEATQLSTSFSVPYGFSYIFTLTGVFRGNIESGTLLQRGESRSISDFEIYQETLNTYIIIHCYLVRMAEIFNFTGKSYEIGQTVIYFVQNMWHVTCRLYYAFSILDMRAFK